VSRTVYVHVGIAKTGTTYLQRTLFTNRDLLRRNGTLYPGPDRSSHFLGSLDLRSARFKGHEYEGAAGAWNRLVAQADAFDGTTVISHETLSHAKPEHIDRAVTSFSTSDVRVVVTARDLARQIPAAWQEQVKNRGQTEYDQFVAQVIAGWRPEVSGEGRFWAGQDIRGVVARWGAAVGADQVTVVTVPPRGADRELLWRRFAEATALPDLPYVFPQRDNSSLGVAEAELLRRLNPRLSDALDWPGYEALIKRRFAEGILEPIDSQGRLRLPQQWVADVADICAAEIDYLRSSGVTVVGNLDDLAPAVDPAVEAVPRGQPADLTDTELLDTALDALARLASRPVNLEPPGLRAAGRSARAALVRQLRTRFARSR
jgi:hypothetical protein